MYLARPLWSCKCPQLSPSILKCQKTVCKLITRFKQTSLFQLEHSEKVFTWGLIKTCLFAFQVSGNFSSFPSGRKWHLEISNLGYHSAPNQITIITLSNGYIIIWFGALDNPVWRKCWWTSWIMSTLQLLREKQNSYVIIKSRSVVTQFRVFCGSSAFNNKNKSQLLQNNFLKANSAFNIFKLCRGIRESFLS